jgi:diaminopimelate decarboxylase
MEINAEIIDGISKQYGDSFYLLDVKQFERNYDELLRAFRNIYDNSHIAYSYKTNYTPKLCKLIDKKGGLAEVVSDMEYKIARRLGVDPKKIIFNGPYKKAEVIEELLIEGDTVNIDSIYELNTILEIAERHREAHFSLGLRCNFDIGDDVRSRFGFDVESENFFRAIKVIQDNKNLELTGFHCHFATRNIETWPSRVQGILELTKKWFKKPPKFISLGGGLFGKMEESLKAQFASRIPTYEDYADIAASQFTECFKSLKPDEKPKLIIEPGTALAGDVMKFVTKLINIKDIRGKKIATLSGSIFNINPTLNKKNLPISVFHEHNNSNKQDMYIDLDFGGYTCIESDYLFRGYSGKLAIGDYIVFDNVGSYSIVLKPPFILPNFAVVEYDEETKSVEVIKHRESFEDVFKTFIF